MNADIVTFDVVVDGKPISSDINVFSIEISQNETDDTARIEIEASDEEMPIPLNNEFRLDSNIEIRLGYNNTNSSAFKGTITDKGVRLSQGTGARNIFICEGASVSKPSTITLSQDSVYSIDLGCDKENNVEGGIEAQGSLEYTAGSTVNFDNVVEGFPKGTVYSVMHEVSEGNWFSTLHFVKPEEVDEPEAKPTTKEADIKTAENKTTAASVSTANDQDITISDANGNSITLSSSGIEIKSPKNITLSADQNISIKGNTGVTQEASGGNVSIKGLNTSINADMNVTVNGAATTTVEAGAELALKAAMVMIN